jgi:hypothetical protein
VRGSKDIFAALQTQPIGTIPIVHNSLSQAAARRRAAIYAGGFFVLAVAAAILIRFPG